MSVSTCPIATVHAPLDRVWRLVSDPSQYDLWWDAHTVSITPPGPAQPGQQVLAYAGALGIKAAVHLTVQSVDAEKHQIEFLTRLPLGITSHNTFTCTALDSRTTRVSFG